MTALTITPYFHIDQVVASLLNHLVEAYPVKKQRNHSYPSRGCIHFVNNSPTGQSKNAIEWVKM
jgi:hypothetical protein